MLHWVFFCGCNVKLPCEVATSHLNYLDRRFLPNQLYHREGEKEKTASQIRDCGAFVDAPTRE